MSSQIHTHTLDKFDKLWKIIDDTIQTGRYVQIKSKLADKGNGRCVNGVFFSYANEFQPLYPDDNNIYTLAQLQDKIMTLLEPRYGYTLSDLSTLGTYKLDDDQIVEKMREKYISTGKIDNGYVAELNNRGWTFEDLRDLLKEMDA